MAECLRFSRRGVARRGYRVVGAAVWLALAAPVQAAQPGDRFMGLYQEHCALCHGDRLEGAAQGTALVGSDLTHGDAVADLAASITTGFPDRGMPTWSAVLEDVEIRGLALLIAEQRTGYGYADFNMAGTLHIPTEVIPSERHEFVLEAVIGGLDPLPYSIAPLPDGRILLTEKLRGLSVISLDGEQSPLVPGAPRGYGDAGAAGRNGLRFGLGWVLDVAVHPRYAENGWVYVAYGDRCEGCNEQSRSAARPVSMARLVRGRIRDGAWADEQVIWQADTASYTAMTDMAVGGRIAFDPDGYVFLSVGMKGGNNHVGIQDLATPHGKVHRMHDDGRIPADNPFIAAPGAVKTTWTVGHRSPHGLEFDPVTRELWETEMGPRGGDEVNRLRPGRNYGWPLHSLGINYDGTPVAYGRVLGIELDADDIEPPVVDLTPSPAVSSFIVYRGEAFPGWRGDLIVGTLKGSDLRRLVMKDGRLVHSEILIDDLARIRDIEVGPEGDIYLLLEHVGGARIVRMRPGTLVPSASGTMAEWNTG